MPCDISPSQRAELFSFPCFVVYLILLLRFEKLFSFPPSCTGGCTLAAQAEPRQEGAATDLHKSNFHNFPLTTHYIKHTAWYTDTTGGTDNFCRQKLDCRQEGTVYLHIYTQTSTFSRGNLVQVIKKLHFLESICRCLLLKFIILKCHMMFKF